MVQLAQLRHNKQQKDAELFAEIKKARAKATDAEMSRAEMYNALIANSSSEKAPLCPYRSR